MDAVPGLPTYFIFTPTKTTEEYRDELRNFPEYNKPKDPNDPESPMLWEAFNYELACAELCGKSHYSMRRLVRIVSEEEYNAWLAKQKSYYMTTIRNTENDPNKGEMLSVEANEHRDWLNNKIDLAVKVGTGAIANVGVPTAELNTIPLEFVQFTSGSDSLTADSKYQLNDLAEALKKYPTMKIEIGGHTDNQGDAASNKVLSQQRANAVKTYLVSQGIEAGRMTAVGYGSSKPKESNDTDAGRQQNRRTEFTITAF